MNGELQSTPREHARLGTEPIDGLRGFAVLLVVFYHTWLFSWINPSIVLLGRDVSYSPFVRPGFLGVEIFFVVSAFCLAFPYVRAQANDGASPALLEYTIRRALKILPSYAIVLVATAAFSLAAHSVTGAAMPGIIAQHLLFVQNFHLDPLGQQNSVLWSLAVEVQFYVIFPVLMFGFSKRPLGVAGLMIAVALLFRNINAACCLHDEDVMRTLPAYLDLFGLGMLAAWAVVRAPLALPFLERHRWIATAIGIAAAYGVVSLLGYVDDRTYERDAHELFYLNGRTLFGLMVALCAAASCLGMTWWRSVLGNPVFTGLSIVSYNIYLWHTLIEIWLAEHRIPYSKLKVPHDDPHWRIPFVLTSFATIAFVSIAVTYFVERPILSLIKPQSFSYPWRRLVAKLRPAPLAPVSSPGDAGGAVT